MFIAAVSSLPTPASLLHLARVWTTENSEVRFWNVQRSIVAKRKHGRPRCWQLWMTWENVEFWISPRVRPWEVDWIMTHSEDYTYVYNFFFSLGLSNMLISDLRVSNSNLRHFFTLPGLVHNPISVRIEPLDRPVWSPNRNPNQSFCSSSCRLRAKTRAEAAALRLRSRGPGTSAGRIWISIDLCWKKRRQEDGSLPWIRKWHGSQLQNIGSKCAPVPGLLPWNRIYSECGKEKRHSITSNFAAETLSSDSKFFCQGLDMGYHHRSLFAQQKASRWISKSFLHVSQCFSLLL